MNATSSAKEDSDRVYTALPLSEESPAEGTNEYEHAIKIIKEYFQPSVNVVGERYKFRQRGQRPGVSIDRCLSALRELAKTCDFGPMTDELIRGQVVEKRTVRKYGKGY